MTVSTAMVAIFLRMRLPQDHVVIAVIEQRLTENNTLKDCTLLSPSEIMDLLRLVLDTTIFTFQGTLYKQATGFLMGSNISPGACNLYIEKFESNALSFVSSGHQTYTLVQVPI